MINKNSKRKKEGLRGMFYYDVDAPSYKPHSFLAKVAEKLGVEVDTHLAAKLGVDNTMFCHIRSRKLRITACMMIRVHDLTGWTIDEIRTLAGIPSTNAMEEKIYGTQEKGTST